MRGGLLHLLQLAVELRDVAVAAHAGACGGFAAGARAPAIETPGRGAQGVVQARRLGRARLGLHALGMQRPAEGLERGQVGPLASRQRIQHGTVLRAAGRAGGIGQQDDRALLRQAPGARGLQVVVDRAHVLPRERRLPARPITTVRVHAQQLQRHKARHDRDEQHDGFHNGPFRSERAFASVRDASSQSCAPDSSNSGRF